MKPYRSIFGLFLSLVLGLASGTMAVARHQSLAPGMQVVICTGHGTLTMTLDATGNPVAPAHPCPDCVAAVSALPLAPTAAPRLPPRAARAAARPPAHGPIPRRPCRARRARGPPGRT